MKITRTNVFELDFGAQGVINLGDKELAELRDKLNQHFTQPATPAPTQGQPGVKMADVIRSIEAAEEDRKKRQKLEQDQASLDKMRFAWEQTRAAERTPRYEVITDPREIARLLGGISG